MIPVTALVGRLAGLAAADTGGFGAALATKIGLISAPFAPNINLQIADITISAETGLTPVTGVAGAQLESVDPITGELLVEIKTPAGGFRWETPVGYTGPTTIYGLAHVDNAGINLLGAQAINPPIILNAPNQSVIAPPIVYRIDPNKVT